MLLLVLVRNALFPWHFEMIRNMLMLHYGNYCSAGILNDLEEN